MYHKITKMIYLMAFGVTLWVTTAILVNWIWPATTPKPTTLESDYTEDALVELHGWDELSLAQTEAHNSTKALALFLMGIGLLAGTVVLTGGRRQPWPGKQVLGSKPGRIGTLVALGGLSWLVGLSWLAFAASQPVGAQALNRNLIPNAAALYNTYSCNLCHGGPGQKPSTTPGYFAASLNPVIGTFKQNKPWGDQQATAPFDDSDGDGFTNGEELQDPGGTWTDLGNNVYNDASYTASPNSSASLPPAPQVTNIVGLNNGQTIGGNLTVKASLHYAGLSKVVYTFKDSNGSTVLEHTANLSGVTNYANNFCLGNGSSSLASPAACPLWNSSVLPNGTYSLTVTAFDKRAVGLGGPRTGSLVLTDLKVNNNFSGPAPTVFTDDKTDNGNCTLREAIIAANTNTPVDQCLPGKPGLDVIPLQTGTYQLSLGGQSEDLAATGDLDITETLNLNGQGDQVTIIDGGGLDRVFDIRNDSHVSLTNLKIQKGGGGVFGGGGILNSGVLSLTHVIVFNNSGEQGGGIYNATGGAPDSLILIDSQVISNTGELGGGIHNTNGAPLTMINSVIKNNLATDSGGGIYHISGGLLTIENSAIHDNRATGTHGGGLDNNGPGPVIITNSAIYNNTAETSGGGINSGAFATTLDIVNSTISGNKADDEGGGIYHSLGTTNLNNVTIFNNTADFDNLGQEDGGGIVRFSGTVNLKNTIIAGNIDNSSAVNHADCSGTLTSQGFNLIQNTTGCTIDATNNIFNQDPQLGPLTGSPAYHPLLSSASPAFDHGSPTAPGSGGNACAATDQRGITRPKGARCDIGAVELSPAVLAIGKTAPAAATAGQQITYIITVSNIGDEAANGVTVTDVIPTGATFVQALDGGVRNGNQVVWSPGSLAANSSTQVRFIVTANQTIVNNTYGVIANGGLNASGSPVTTTIEGSGGDTGSYSLYLPLVIK